MILVRTTFWKPSDLPLSSGQLEVSIPDVDSSSDLVSTKGICADCGSPIEIGTGTKHLGSGQAEWVCNGCCTHRNTHWGEAPLKFEIVKAS